jgi:superfamily II DNA or RNA helicase
MVRLSVRPAILGKALEMTEIKLRPWQAECSQKAIDWLHSGTARHFLMNAAPGAGKTICSSVIARRLFDANLIDRVIVIAPRKVVVKQWAHEFKLVTGRPMLQITGADEEPEEYGLDLCATWSAIQGSLDGLHAVCRKYRTLVICDEHHHAAVEAAWGDGANGAFADAKFALILTGTPIRSDGRESVWLAYDDQGLIDHPEGGSYTLTYGKAVDPEYCRPITFHRHEGKFSVTLDDGENISVSGMEDTKLTDGLKRIRGLQQALDYYRLACTPKYLPNGAADLTSYQASMLEWCIDKLNDLRLRMPEAAGLIIAPNIPVAEYMAELLELLDGEKPVVVHNQVANAEGKITAFRNSRKRWIVSVSMISEGVDIQRLRVLAYLPNAQTELAFRQAMGRVVRNFGPLDDSRAYVVMPTHRIFEAYARRAEAEMPPVARRLSEESDTKVCPHCGAECPKDATHCHECDAEFPVRQPRMKTCDACGALNSLAAKTCQNCGADFRHHFEISLTDALRVGAIIRGMDLDEDEVREGEAIRDVFRKGVLGSGDDQLIKILRLLPEESYGRLARMIDDSRKH